MEKISKNIKKRGLKDSEAFKRGVENAKKYKVSKRNLPRGLKPLWVKKHITSREWDKEYKYISSYHNLGKDFIDGRERIKIGFLMVGSFIPDDCEELTNEEVIQLDRYRQAHNIHPYPLTRVDN